MKPFFMTKSALVAAIQDPETKGKRGTFVYELYKRYDCKDLLPLLTNCLIYGSWEEANHVCDIFGSDEIQDWRKQPGYQESVADIKLAAKSDKPNNAEFLEEALELLGYG